MHNRKETGYISRNVKLLIVIKKIFAGAYKKVHKYTSYEDNEYSITVFLTQSNLFCFIFAEHYYLVCIYKYTFKIKIEK